MDKEIRLSLNKASLEDLKDIVNIHKKCFPDYFLTNIGEEFLLRYYKEYLISSHSIVVISKVDKITTSFIVGTMDSGKVLSSFYKRNFLFIVCSVFKQLLKLNPIIIRGLKKRLMHINMAINSLLKSNIDNKESSPNEGARLLSIATLPEYRMYKVSSRINDYFEQQLRNENIKKVGLSVKEDNNRAIRFYEKSGYGIEKRKNRMIFLDKLL